MRRNFLAVRNFDSLEEVRSSVDIPVDTAAAAAADGVDCSSLLGMTSWLW